MSVNYSLIIEQKILQLLSLSSTAVSSILQPNSNIHLSKLVNVVQNYKCQRSN
ncbi:hypothetical protein [Orientia tsutsugamushi]|uniref:hypothetical protein n=1 Tax=Orientia tsutsugamushi TaxID=784 RepID=UPI00352741F9